MPFPEKIAWVSMAGIIVAFGPYFALLAAWSGPAPAFPLYSGALLFVATLLTIIVTTLGAIGAALTNVKDANAPADERDRMVARRASAIAYAVLLPLLFLTLAGAVLGFGTAGLANAVLAAIVLAEVSRCGAAVFLYRSGWHG